MTGGELTLGAVLARLEEREQEIAAQAEAAREKIAELTTLLDGFDKATEEIRITRKTLLELPDPAPPAPPVTKLPDHPAYQQIMAVFAAADAPLRARAVCEAMDVEIAQQRQQRPREAQAAGRARDPGRDRAGVVHPAPAIAAPRAGDQAACRNRKSKTGVNSLTASECCCPFGVFRYTGPSGCRCTVSSRSRPVVTGRSSRRQRSGARR